MPMPALILICVWLTVSEIFINDSIHVMRHSTLDEKFLKSLLVRCKTTYCRRSTTGRSEGNATQFRPRQTGTKIIEKSEGSKRCITFPRFALRFVVVVIIKESNTTLFKHIDLAVLTNSFPTLPSYLLHCNICGERSNQSSNHLYSIY